MPTSPWNYQDDLVTNAKLGRGDARPPSAFQDYQSSGGFGDFQASQAYRDFQQKMGGAKTWNYRGVDAERQKEEYAKLQQAHYEQYLEKLYAGTSKARPTGAGNGTSPPAPLAQPASPGSVGIAPGGAAAPSPAVLRSANRSANALPGGQFAPGAGTRAGFGGVTRGETAPAPSALPQATGGIPTPPVGAAARAPGTGAPAAPGFPGVKPIVPPRTGLGTQMGTAGMR